jgi:hypothetical protein
MCFTISKFLFKGHLIREVMKIPETINKNNPNPINLEIEGIIFQKAFLISESVLALLEIMLAIVAPPKPKANPRKCIKLNISNHIK